MLCSTPPLPGDGASSGGGEVGGCGNGGEVVCFRFTSPSVTTMNLRSIIPDSGCLRVRNGRGKRKERVMEDLGPLAPQWTASTWWPRPDLRGWRRMVDTWPTWPGGLQGSVSSPPSTAIGSSTTCTLPYQYWGGEQSEHRKHVILETVNKSYPARAAIPASFVAEES